MAQVCFFFACLSFVGYRRSILLVSEILLLFGLRVPCLDRFFAVVVLLWCTCVQLVARCFSCFASLVWSGCYLRLPSCVCSLRLWPNLTGVFVFYLCKLRSSSRLRACFCVCGASLLVIFPYFAIVVARVPPVVSSCSCLAPPLSLRLVGVCAVVGEKLRGGEELLPAS